MIQDLVLGPDIVEFVGSKGWYPGKIEGKIVELNKELHQDYICIDSDGNIEQKIEDRVLEMDDMTFEWWSDVWDRQLSFKKFSGIEKPLFIKGVTEEDQLEASIAKKLIDCIWLKRQETLDSRKEYLLKLKSGPVKPITFDDYIKSDNPRHKLIRLEKQYDLNVGDYFPFPIIYKPIFKNSKNVTIYDPYIVKHWPGDTAVVHVEKIINLCSQDCNILIKSYSLKNYTKSFQDGFVDKGKESAIEEWKIELESKYKNVKVELLTKKENDKRRYIYLDDYLINLGHGLQCFGKNNKMIEKNFVILSRRKL